MTDVLKTLTKEQRNYCRSLIRQAMVAVKAGNLWEPDTMAQHLIPEPEPVMVPLEDVLPLLADIDEVIVQGLAKSCGSADTFRAKHKDKL